jgi:hypothetical protein
MYLKYKILIQTLITLNDKTNQKITAYYFFNKMKGKYF